MRVPTYANYMNLTSAISQNRSNVDKYSYQSVSGLKYQDYAGYGMKAYNMVSMESTLNVTNTFMANNELAQISLNASNLSLQTISDVLLDVKAALNDAYSTDLKKVSPDYTGGELTFTSNDINKYVGKTLTIKGTTYTFATDDSDTNNINIAGKTSADDIMQAVADKIQDVTYTGTKLTFDLYSVDGLSTLLTEEPAKSAVTTGTPYVMSSEQKLALDNLQNIVFSSMQMIADTLNTNVGGSYIFGGGSSTAPVSFEYASLKEFQSYYDGVHTIYPDSTSSVLSHFEVNNSNTGVLTFNANGQDKGVITATNTGGFLEEAIRMNDSTVGTVTFDGDANTMKADQYGAFSSLHAGDTIVINGSNGDLTPIANVYIVKSVSADGRTVTFDDSTKIAISGQKVITPDNDVVVNKTFPKGAVINLEGFNNNNLAPTATVEGVSPDGSQLFIKIDGDRLPDGMTTAGNAQWSIEAETYYKGGSLEYNQRISESQTISFDVKASDPVFEKIFQALGAVAQGNLVDDTIPFDGSSFDPNRAYDRIKEAIDLLASATDGAGDISQAPNSSLYSVTAKISANYTILNKVMENQKQAVAGLENNIAMIKNADKDEAAVKLLMAEQSLEASYSILSSVSKLSLLDYIK